MIKRAVAALAVHLTRLTYRLGSPHIYLSTGCLHGDHDYCKAMTGANGTKRPAQCKSCGAHCICRCHRTPATQATQTQEQP